MTDLNICERLHSEALAIAPTDGTPEALEYGIEVAREELDWLDDIRCGLDVDSKSAEFSCNKRFICPLKEIVKVLI